MLTTYDIATGQVTVDESYTPQSLPVSVPSGVQRGQARHILGRSTLSNGVLTIHAGWQSPSLLTAVDALCAAAGGETADIWQNLVILRRDSPTLAVLAQALGLTSAHLDTLFIAAAQVAL